MRLQTFIVTLTLEGPIITSASALGRFGLDSVMARTAQPNDPEKDRFYLPYSLLKGLVREAWQDFGWEHAIQDWLGEKSKEASDDAPERGRLVFGDALDLTTDADRIHPIHVRTRMDSERGSVDEGALLFIEAPYPPGKSAAFQATLRAWLDENESTEDLRRLLLAAFRWISAAGGERSVGFGRILDAQVNAPNRPASVTIADAVRYRVELRFDRPICFAKPRVHPNIFEASDVIPGSAIKAVIAQTIKKQVRFRELNDNLHSIVCQAAFPSEDQARPVRFPQSLVRTEQGLRDAIFQASAPDRIESEVRFSVDWKSREFPPLGYAWPTADLEVRVRTAIEGETRRAKDDELFAYEMVVPRTGPPGNRKSLEWIGTVDLSAVPRNALEMVCAQLLDILGQGLIGLGKTKACATLSVVPTTAETPPLGQTVVLTLQTDALLLDPGKCDGPLLDAYRDAWTAISNGTLVLQHFFHRSHLEGGEYVYHRFQKQLGDGVYRPYLLTDSGSVFVFRTNPGAADEVHRLLRSNLPIPAATRKFYQLPVEEQNDDWRFCPYLPQNGYGEIAIDLHASRLNKVPLLTEADYVPANA